MHLLSELKIMKIKSLFDDVFLTFWMMIDVVLYM